VRVAQLVWREAAPDPGLGGEPAELYAHPALDHGRPRVGPSMMQNSGPIGSCPCAQPRLKLPQPHSSMPTSRRRPPYRSAPMVAVVLGDRERLLDAQAGAPHHDDHRSYAPAMPVIGCATHDRHDLLHRRRDGRVSHSLVARRSAGVLPGQSRPASDAAPPRRALTTRSWDLPGSDNRYDRCPTPPTEAGATARPANRASCQAQTRALHATGARPQRAPAQRSR
jgi:hypothetical protein